MNAFKKSLRAALCGSLAAVFIFGAGALQAQNGSAPLTLEACVELALKTNSQVLNSKRRVDVAGTQVTDAYSMYLPSVNSSFSSARRRNVFDGPRIDLQTGTAITGSYSTSHSMSLNYNQTIFDFGNGLFTIRQARANRQSTENTYKSTRIATIGDVHEAYYQLLKDVRLLEVNREAERSSAEQLKRTQSMYEIGSVAQADVYRSKTTNGQDRINLIRQENNVRYSRANLNFLLGRQPEGPLEIVDPADIEVSPRDYTLDEIMESALTANPGLHRYKADMAAASHGVKAARTNYLPTLSLNASFSRTGDQLGLVYENFDQNYFAQVFVSMRFNIFNGFRDKSNAERSSINYRIARENLTEEERRLRQRAQQALLGLQAAKEISVINEENLLSAQEDLRLAEERYRVGAGTLLDVITAQASLVRAKSESVRAKYDAKIADATLKEVMGSFE